ncbi:hypothetical protein C8R48DRAFT_690638 [Suillus tomentosus]|nr:hypothetical protein C8R48DRAFT_711828 [Suillus tomentosus]KAG1866463.1 hypothetical protein C8R48DRAFT_705212 [Suillus tomentosus]KAG1876080.1 hypothetical protein C8R48DRAFT_690638 [Suillus tomentosus]
MPRHRRVTPRQTSSLPRHPRVTPRHCRVKLHSCRVTSSTCRVRPHHLHMPRQTSPPQLSHCPYNLELDVVHCNCP